MITHLRMLIVLTLIFVFSFAGLAQASQVPVGKPPDSNGTNTGYPLEKWRIDNILTEGSAGMFASLALDPDHDQLPWISFYRDLNPTTSDLWIATRVNIAPGNCGPANQWYCGSIVAEPDKHIGGSTSIDIFPDINPDPAISTWKVGISYVNYTDLTLNYAEYTCPAGVCSWSHAVVADLAPLTALLTDTSLQFDAAGHPHIAFHAELVIGDFTYNDVIWAEWIGPGGNCGDPSVWYCEPVAQLETDLIDLQPSLAISPEGMDAIAYHDPATGFLMFATRLGDGTGNCGTLMNWDCETIDYRGFDIGQNPSLHAPLYPGGAWWIVYDADSDAAVRLAISNADVTGNCGDDNNWRCVDIQSGYSYYISLDMINYNAPVFAFSTVTDDYPYASVALAALSHVGGPYNCGWSFWCGILDAGTATLREGTDLSLKINAEGRAMIAYAEDDVSSGNNVYNLKFATEQQWVLMPIAIR